MSVASKIQLTEVTQVFDRRLWRSRFSIAGKSHTYLQFSDAVAAARTECWENSACERGEKQVQVVVEEEEEEEIENNRRYLHAELTRGPCQGNRPVGPDRKRPGSRDGERSANPAPPPLACGGLGLAATQPQGRC